MNHMFDQCDIEAGNEKQANEIVRKALSDGSFWEGMSTGTWNGDYWEVDDNATDLVSEFDDGLEDNK
jgi:hypothetical protein